MAEERRRSPLRHLAWILPVLPFFVLLFFLDEVKAIVEWLDPSPPETRSATREELEEAGWSFPAWELDESLLEEVAVFPRSGFRSAQGTTFLADGEGGGALLVSHPDEWGTYDERGERVGARPVEGWGAEVVRFEDTDGTAYVVEQRGEMPFSRATEVLCRREADGEIVWSRRSTQLDWKGTDPIRLDDGRALVLCHGYEDWFALHPDGEIAWDRSDEVHASYGHRTHPDLPGVYLCFFGDATWRRSVDGSQLGAELDGSAYIVDAEVFPGPDGERLAFVVGSDGTDRSAILVVDESGAVRWIAEAPPESLDVARLDRADGAPLFVVAASTGDLLVVDAEGTAIYHTTLPQVPREKVDVAIYEIDAGPLGEDHLGVAVTLLDWIAVYRTPR